MELWIINYESICFKLFKLQISYNRCKFVVNNNSPVVVLMSKS